MLMPGLELMKQEERRWRRMVLKRCAIMAAGFAGIVALAVWIGVEVCK